MSEVLARWGHSADFVYDADDPTSDSPLSEQGRFYLRDDLEAVSDTVTALVQAEAERERYKTALEMIEEMSRTIVCGNMGKIAAAALAAPRATTEEEGHRE